MTRVIKTCKRLHSIVNTRSLWLVLLTSLDIKHAPRFAPHERAEELSMSELKSRVIHALHSSSIWTERRRAPRIVDIANLPLEARPWSLNYGIFAFSRPKPRFVPGGAHIFVQNNGRLELWCVRSARRLWITPDPSERLLCRAYAFEMQQGGESLVVAAAYVHHAGENKWAILTFKGWLADLPFLFLVSCECIKFHSKLSTIT